MSRIERPPTNLSTGLQRILIALSKSNGHVDAGDSFAYRVSEEGSILELIYTNPISSSDLFLFGRVVNEYTEQPHGIDTNVEYDGEVEFHTVTFTESPTDPQECIYPVLAPLGAGETLVNRVELITHQLVENDRYFEEHLYELPLGIIVYASENSADDFTELFNVDGVVIEAYADEVAELYSN